MLTKETKTCIKLVETTLDDFQALVEKVSQVLDLTEPEKLAILEENLTVIINTNHQSEIDAVNAIDQSIVDFVKAKKSKQAYLLSTAQKGNLAILEWRGILYDFLVAKAQDNTLYPNITSQSVFDTYESYLGMLYSGMLNEVIIKINALPVGSLVVDEFYPLGQTTTKVRDYYVSYLQGL